ncbi:MAG: hypothetical protein RSF92_10995 [Niameybacter sp.]|uniref:hypothetical protein n=1 Tax=Niameybacter sp. TaxID=2033640 RepID=UPI002FC8AD42
MVTMKMIRYNISESFNVVRWCLTLLAFSFVAVVSVAKYIQLSDMTAITFSSLETTYLILNDTMSVVYIYLPLYLFLMCGLMFDDNFGALEVIKCKSRGKWYLGKWVTLLFYTLVFFICLFGMNFLICNQVFPYSTSWSSDFLRVQVMMGQSARNFLYGPIETIGLSLGSVFFLYLVAGMMSMFFSLLTNKEAYAFFISLILGILISVAFVYGLKMTSQLSFDAFMWRNGILFVGTCLVGALGLHYTYKKDFNLEQKV